MVIRHKKHDIDVNRSGRLVEMSEVKTENLQDTKLHSRNLTCSDMGDMRFELTSEAPKAPMLPSYTNPP